LCQVEKPLEDFPKHNQIKDGRHPRCKECRQIEQRERYNQTFAYQKVRRKKETTRQLYNLTEGQFIELLNEQGGCCSICKRLLEKPCIDHCHTTGKIRGILCNNCNAGLGMFKDNPEWCEKAAEYLRTADTGHVANHSAILQRWKRKRLSR
jgi:hypothetical protein